jgi:hypothetical protein
VTLDDVANDGGAAFGGKDNIRDSVERVSGSDFADRLTGDERRNSFLGLGGGDTINPGTSVDEVFAGIGTDTCSSRTDSSTSPMAVRTATRPPSTEVSTR